MSMRATILLGCLLALSGCGARDSSSYFPLQPGARWTYAVET